MPTAVRTRLAMVVSAVFARKGERTDAAIELDQLSKPDQGRGALVPVSRITGIACVGVITRSEIHTPSVRVSTMNSAAQATTSRPVAHRIGSNKPTSGCEKSRELTHASARRSGNGGRVERGEPDPHDAELAAQSGRPSPPLQGHRRGGWSSTRVRYCSSRMALASTVPSSVPVLVRSRG